MDLFTPHCLGAFNVCLWMRMLIKDNIFNQIKHFFVHSQPYTHAQTSMGIIVNAKEL